MNTHQLIALISAIWAAAWLQISHRERCVRPLGTTKQLENRAAGTSLLFALNTLIWIAA